MNLRLLVLVAAVVLLTLAVTAIDTQHVVWNPPWPVRLGMGGVGVLLAFGATQVGRTPRDKDPV